MKVNLNYRDGGNYKFDIENVEIPDNLRSKIIIDPEAENEIFIDVHTLGLGTDWLMDQIGHEYDEDTDHPFVTVTAIDDDFKATPEEEKRNLAECVAVIAYWLGDSGKKVGGEGMIANYDTIVQIAEAFCKVFPAGFQWEDFYEAGGDCWDVTCEAWAEMFIDKARVRISDI